MSFRRVLALVAGSVAVHLAVVACGSADGPIFGEADRDAGAAGAGGRAEPEPEVSVEPCNLVTDNGVIHYAAHAYPELTSEEIALNVTAVGRLSKSIGYVPDDFRLLAVPITINDKHVAAVSCDLIAPFGAFESVTFIRR